MMLTSSETVKQDLDRLTNEQLQQVADFIAFLKYRSKRDRIHYHLVSCGRAVRLAESCLFRLQLLGLGRSPSTSDRPFRTDGDKIGSN